MISYSAPSNKVSIHVTPDTGTQPQHISRLATVCSEAVEESEKRLGRHPLLALCQLAQCFEGVPRAFASELRLKPLHVQFVAEGSQHVDGLLTIAGLFPMLEADDSIRQYDLFRDDSKDRVADTHDLARV